MLSTRHPRQLLLLLVFTTFLGGCASGARMLKEPVPIEPISPLADVSEHDVKLTLDWVIVRDGPGTWAENADWDEYVVSVRNDTQAPIHVTHFKVVDSLDTIVEALNDRKALVRSSRETVKRYSSEDLQVVAGASPGALLAYSGAAVIVGGGVASYALATSILAGSTGAGTALGVAGTAATGVFIAAPFIAVRGIVKASRNNTVNKEIQKRRTQLPVEISPGDEQLFTVFFPLAPSPQSFTASYVQNGQEFELTTDTNEALGGLHIASNNENEAKLKP